MPLLDKRNRDPKRSTSKGIEPSTRAFWSQNPQTEAMQAQTDLPGLPVFDGPTRGTPILSRDPRPRGLLSTCANPRCASGWLHLWRSRSGPIFEGGWSCSAACTEARVEAAVRRELGGRSAGQSFGQHRHRVPLGLVMLEQGWVTSEQLRKAMEAQRSGGEGRLGDWLIEHQGISEQLVTRALGLQWNCPVLSLDGHDPETMAAALPRLFVEAFSVLPVRVAAGSILYCGFEDRLDPALTLAIERISGLRVESGIVRGSSFAAAHERQLQANFPPAKLVAAESESPLIRALTRAIERVRPVEARLARMHDCLWLRMWKTPTYGALPESSEVEDLLLSLAAD